MSVRAFQPRKIDPPHFVAEDIDELEGREGEFVGAEQCDGCGNSSYRIEKSGLTFVARCAVDSTDADEFKHPDPCGTAYAITVWDDDQVVF